MKKLFVVVSMMLLAGCSHSDSVAQRLLTQEGISEVRLNGHPLFSGCADDETYATAFTGKKNGLPVRGVICGGVFKANTIRYK